MTSSRPLISRKFVVQHQRRRLFEAVATLSTERGYEETSINDLVRRAAVARKTLYANFDGKEELFLAAIEDAIAAAIDRVEAACTAKEEWHERLEAGLEALLAEIAEHPDRAHLWLVTASAATPASAELYERAMRRFLVLLRAVAPTDAGLSQSVEESLVGGVAWILYRQLRRGEAEQAPDLLPDLCDFVFAPYDARGPD